MKGTETASNFHRRYSGDNSDPGQFYIYRSDDQQEINSFPHNRRDFYKIAFLIKGEGILSYADRAFHIAGGNIAFFNPMIPFSWESLEENVTGYSCIFTEDFINHNLKTEILSKSPLFKVSGEHVLTLDQYSMQFLKGIFEQMLSELQSPYVHKYDLLRSYIQIIMHESLKVAPAEHHQQRGNSSARISSLFLELLDRQFPITSPQNAIRFKNANEYSNQLSVHTNHLNRSLKEITGKTTTEHIKESITKEAKYLLLHSDWDIAEIGYCLGFKHASNFNIFFKKQTGQTPNYFRKQLVAIS